MKKLITAALGLAAATLMLSGCNEQLYGQGTTSTPSNQTGYARQGDASSIPSESPTADETTPSTSTSLMTTDSALGTIVTDGDGMVVYQFDNDTQGSGMSSCTGDCLENWPVVPGGDSAAMLEGITGEATTITGPDGTPQLALKGWPLYYYAGDNVAGDVNGQAVGGVWWVIGPDGQPIHD